MNAALIGFGLLGSHFHELLKEHNALGKTIFFDDIAASTKNPTAYPFVEHLLDSFSKHDFFVCLGYKHLAKRVEIVNLLLSRGRSVPRYVHPTSYQHTAASLGPGSMIFPSCTIDVRAKIGTGALLHNGVIVSHDSTIGDGCYLAPGVVVSGNVTIGDCTFIGTGTVVANGVRIGKNCIIGIGSVITQDVPDGTSAIGNPMRILSRKLSLT